MDAGVLSADLTEDAETALVEKQGGSVGGAAGACALLRLRLDRVHDWTENPHNRFRWLPDATVGFAEHLAREDAMSSRSGASGASACHGSRSG